MDTAFWQRQLDALLAAPLPSLIFLALGTIATWWLSSTIWKARLAAAHERVGALEERLRLVAEQARQSKEVAEKLLAELEGFRMRTQERTILSPQEVVDGTTRAMTYVARIIKYEHDLGETLDKIPIVRPSKMRRDERTRLH
jgi:hypothetical protein